MVADMLFAVAVVAVAAGAVPEFQVRVSDIRFTAYSAAVCLGGACGRCFAGVGRPKLDYFRAVSTIARGGLARGPVQFCSPGCGKQIHNVLTEEQQIVGDGNDGEKVGREGECKQIEQNNGQVEQSEKPCLNGNNEE